MKKQYMDNKSKKVGFIGLGAMGFGMACNIVKSGFSTTVYDIDKKKSVQLQIRAL